MRRLELRRFGVKRARSGRRPSVRCIAPLACGGGGTQSRQPCRVHAGVRACTRCCSSASSPAEGGVTCCSGAASSCTALEGPPRTSLSLRQQSRRSRWRSRRMASTLRRPMATTPSRCGLLSRPQETPGAATATPRPTPGRITPQHAPPVEGAGARGGGGVHRHLGVGPRATHPTRASAGR